MARCFPYARDPVAETMFSAAAVAEPTADKLQKEREMMQKKEKKERKKEKKRQKKAAQLDEKYKTSDHHSKLGHKKRKHEDCEIVGQETRNVYKEHLEKSSLSEEHEAPSYSKALRCTPESSLDSGKRLRIDLSSSPNQTRNGFLRLKFTPTNQRRDPEGTTGMSMKPRVTEQSPAGMDLSMANRKRELQPHVKTVSAVKHVVAQQKNMSIRNGNCLGEPRKVSQQHDAKSMQRVSIVQKGSTESTPIVMQKVDRHLFQKVAMQRANPVPEKVMQGVEAAPVKARQRANPAPTKVIQGVEASSVKAMQRAGHLTPLEVLNRESTTQVHLRKETGAAPLSQFNIERPTLLNKPNVCADPPVMLSKPKVCVKPPCLPNKPVSVCVESPALLNKPKVHVQPPVIKQHQQILPRAEDRCSVGSVTPAKEAEQSSSDRKSRKIEKKERKLADLFVNWKPSPIQMEVTEGTYVGEQDWLFSCGSTSKMNCRTFDGSARCQPTEQNFSLQPRAVYLPDLHICQMPFVVPF
uniref:Uncharacterized protein n=1 Tax=Leersia perrieri TaxID=77586 RepID=A0A0D9XHG3_9ORYZ